MERDAVDLDQDVGMRQLMHRDSRASRTAVRKKFAVHFVVALEVVHVDAVAVEAQKSRLPVAGWQAQAIIPRHLAMVNGGA